MWTTKKYSVRRKARLWPRLREFQNTKAPLWKIRQQRRPGQSGQRGGKTGRMWRCRTKERFSKKRQWVQTEGCRPIKYEGGEMSTESREVISDPSKICLRSLLGWKVYCSGLRTAYTSGNSPTVFPSLSHSHPGLKIVELLQLPLLSLSFILLDHFPVLSVLFQQYLLLLSSFLQSYCHFTNSKTERQRRERKI